jgi:thiosulfate/3-mercaptopyruvate sulfurtransferase
MWSNFNRRAAVLCLSAGLCLCEQASTPLRQSELIEPSALVKALEGRVRPYLLCVAPPVLYHGRHIRNAVFAGPGDTPDGIALLKTIASKLPKDGDIVIYCGCCPLEKCPNVRPALAALRAMGFAHVRVLDVVTNMHTDWYSRGYPSEASGETN